MKILTCNIRAAFIDDGEFAWDYRKSLCIDTILQQQAHVVCFQEMTAIQSDDMKKAFGKDFDFYGMVDEAHGEHPMNTIMYHKELFSLHSSGGYWLSNHPHVPSSKDWDSDCIRIANWVVLTERSSGKRFRVVNTHLDHISQKARENQAGVVIADGQAYEESFPQILTGDMNCDHSNKAIEVFKSAGWVDTYEFIHKESNPGYTFHGFMGERYGNETIGKMDWIFVRGAIEISDAALIKDNKEGFYPSDHYFISAEVNI